MNQPVRLTLVFLVALALQSCGGKQDESSGDAGAAAEAPPAAPAAMAQTGAPPGAAVFFITPVNGQTVSSPVTVKFGISGMAVAPAGDATPNTGHHHLLVDVELADASVPVPSDPNHLHFGKGQTETELELTPGTHRLQLVLGGRHLLRSGDYELTLTAEGHYPLTETITVGPEDSQSFDYQLQRLPGILSFDSRPAGAQVLILPMEIPPNYGTRYTSSFRDSYPLVAQRTDSLLAPFILDGIATDPALMQGDGIHPTASAQPTMVDNILPTVLEALDQSD